MRSHHQHRRGTATVEFALVAPIFVLLIFGMVEVGRALMVKQLLTNASREGARIGVLDGATTAQVTTKVTDYLKGASVNESTVTVSPSPPSSAAYGSPVTVSVTVSFDKVSWMPAPWFLGGKTLRATSVMRRESAQ